MVKTSTLAIILAALIISVAFTAEVDGAGLVKRAISTAGRWQPSDLPVQTVLYNNTNTYDDGIKQTFNPDATNAGLNVGSHTAAPASPVNGDIYLDSTSNKLFGRINGVWVDLGTTGDAILSGTQTFTGVNTMSGQNVIDTAQSGLVIRNTVGNFATTLAGGAVAANQTLTLPDITGGDTVASLGMTQTFTGTNTFTPKTIHSGGINIPAIADITTDGDFWQNSTRNVLKYRASSTTYTVESSKDIATSFVPANATGIATTAGAMMGYGGTVSVTPASTARFLVTFCATSQTSGAGTGYIQIRYGTGTAPVNGAALSGTTAGPVVSFTPTSASDRSSSCSTAVITGLNTGTAYWIDVGLRSTSAITSTLLNSVFSVVEV